MVCVKVVSTPVRANLNSQYIASRTLSLSASKIEHETLTQATACVQYVV